MLTLMVFKVVRCLSLPKFSSGFAVLFVEVKKLLKVKLFIM